MIKETIQISANISYEIEVVTLSGNILKLFQRGLFFFIAMSKKQTQIYLSYFLVVFMITNLYCFIIN